MTRTAELSLLAAVCLAAGIPGPQEAASNRILLALSILFWTASALRQARRQGATGWAAGVAAAGPPLAAALVVGRLADPIARLAVLVAGVSLAAAPARRQACRFTGSALGLALALDLLPLAWGTEVELSRLASRAMGSLSGGGIDWGPSASGLDLLFSALLLIGSRRAGARHARMRVSCCCIAVWLLFLAAAPALASWRPEILFGEGALLNQAREHREVTSAGAAPAIFSLSWLLLGAFGAVCAASGRAGSETQESLRTRGLHSGAGGPVMNPGRDRRGPAGSSGFSPMFVRDPGGTSGPQAPASTLCACSALGAMALGAVLAAAWWPGEPRPHGRVVLVKSRWVDLDVPRHDRPGIASSGMLGLLGRYLALDGHDVVAEDRPVTPVLLRGAAGVVLPLPDSMLAREEKEALDRFVRRGGSMLVLADHTDMLGTMAAVNDLTAPYGVQARFDSAYPARRGWRGCLRTKRPLPPGEETGIGTGASLALRGKARPLVVGRHALGDAGDRSNGGPGGFLGDYAWQAGERLGDLVLASETRAGRGRVIVMGDTSSLQNVALPWCRSFVAALFDHMARRESPWRAAAAAGGGIAGLALLAAALLSRSPARWTGTTAVGTLAAGLAAGAAAAPATLPLPTPAAPSARMPLPTPAASGPVALVVDGHLNAWTRDLWSEASIGGLMANLQRAGYLPVVARGLPSGPLDATTLIAIVAPRAALSPGEALDLSAHVEKGGKVLVAAGGAESAAVAPLLSMYGLTVRGLPLGPVPVRADMTRSEYDVARRSPQFRNAHPIDSAGLVLVRSFHRDFDRDVAVRARGRSGRGALIVVGDPEFLTDRVLENERTSWAGNVELLATLLAEEG